MAGLLKQIFGGGRTYVPAALLPTEGWTPVPGIARLSLVWPWTAELECEPLVDSHGRSTGITPTIELVAPRSDRDVGLIIWAEPNGGLAVGPDWAASVGRMYSGRVEADVAFVLGGATGRMARVSDGRTTSWRVLVPRHDSAVHIETNVPAAHAAAYWAQIESMLATWTWTD